MMTRHLADPNNPSQPLEFPAVWASEWGHDEIGLWMGFTYKGVSYRFRWILPGEFLMGDEEWEFTRPVHPVHITHGFWLGETVVTQALWQAVIGENPSRFKGDERPVERVSWDDVQDFIKTLNQEESELKLCLPTEAQWEFACRAGTTTKFFFGDELLESNAHFGKDYGKGSTVGVRTKPPNRWGLYQMHGNVWEWCEDLYNENFYKENVKFNPIVSGKFDFSHRVLRGGGWYNDAVHARSSYRDSNKSISRDSNVGFRLARALLIDVHEGIVNER